MSSFKLLALDIDGTLTNSEKKVTERTKAAVRKAQDAGVQIVLASGRPVIGLTKIIEALNLQETGGYCMAYNGGQIFDCRTGKDLYRLTIDERFYPVICEAGRKFDIGILTYNSEGVISEKADNPFVRKEAFNNGVPVFPAEDLESVIEGPVSKFMAVGVPEKLQEAYPYLQAELSDELHVFFSESYFVEIVPQGIEKAAGLAKLLELTGFTREQLMVCGDGLNDIPMLKYAGFAAAMANAYDETKACADVVVSSNDEDGVAEAIERFILN